MSAPCINCAQCRPLPFSMYRVKSKRHMLLFASCVILYDPLLLCNSCVIPPLVQKRIPYSLPMCGCIGLLSHRAGKVRRSAIIMKRCHPWKRCFCVVAVFFFFFLAPYCIPLVALVRIAILSCKSINDMNVCVRSSNKLNIETFVGFTSLLFDNSSNHVL